MSISPAAIKELREKTGAGMMDCKKALTEANGDLEAAIDWLRKKGLASAAKKSGRVAAEGLVATSSSDDLTKAALIELNSETDFVARNEQFQELASVIAGYALDVDGDIEALKTFECKKANKPVNDVVTEAVASIGENIQLRRSAALSVANGVVATYIHNAVSPNLGKIGVLVALESTGDKAKLEQFGKQIAMHIAAARPEALTRDGVSTEKLDREREVLKDQAIASGKPAEIAEKMVEGRIRKYYEEVVLLEQIYVIDGKAKVQEAIDAFAKELGSDVKITAYEHFKLGDGIEKEEDNFAEEVAKAAASA
ncbi:MAG: translation elongation factor Ts [Rickettsiales bacterium]|nr:translation elongation factor Ts [Rickettsiales bacterium]